VKYFWTYSAVTPLNQRSHGPSRSELLNDTISFFEAAGWEIVTYKNASADFEAKHRGFRLFVSCIDTKILTFLPPSEILARLREQGKDHHKKMGATLVAVWNFAVPGLSFEDAATSEVLIFSESELQVISSLIRFYSSLPVNLTEREALLLQRNLEICISISERYKKRGEIQRSIEWLERAVRGSAGISIAYRKLCGLYRELGDLDSIERIARDVVRVKPDHLEYLSMLQNIATDREEGELAAEWHRQIVRVTEESKDFESLMRRLKTKAEPRGTPSQPSAPPRMMKLNLLSRMFRRDKKA
jgi:tetratricopeptide (TPR) repeat protein